MKIVILNTSERTGGAAVAAGRLGKALKQAGIQVNKLVRDDTWLNRFRFYWERLIIFLCNHLNRKNLFAVSIANTGTDLSGNLSVKEADIIHFHWINQGFLSLKDIEALVKLNKPIVWTMHDMWPCTSICHHARDCEKFQTGCESCFFLKSKGKDLSTSVFDKKLSLYKDANITFVGCSRWLSGRAKKSYLLQDKTVLSIPNPIDTEVYHPMDQGTARELLGLPSGKKLLLFGALNVTDKRKGIDYLIAALRKIEKQDVELVVFGQVKDDIRGLFPVPIHSMGYLSDESKIVALYNAVDIFITSSLEENLPNTIMESMACGTPCVGFEIGGIPEMIDHKINGYVTNYKDANDLANGIQWVLEHGDRQALSDACVKKVQENYTDEVIAGKYLALYQNILCKNDGKL
ncbi:glycosyltransferase family 4 protein [Parabacteroides hominis]|jgi:glycosyltransferase involved in cell wall biosynthesis|uniref:Glycosyltransferase family 4 protein n=1 Tax=Parabacteroides hominis TaxID=2763057 RepID=A0ABR7DPF8_9BACT|nr:glycosyltransferase family 4 protein [Parabacteroides hominis]MBC5632688.1 glycosyltransferase family 4 protein [Parabacteroides hominis]MBD9166985.1 glycosyltransferase [Parabacteroides johnsonii]